MMLTLSSNSQRLSTIPMLRSHCKSASASIGGLHLYHDFLEPRQVAQLQTKAIALSRALFEQPSIKQDESTHSFFSKCQKIQCEQFYRLIEIDDEQSGKITGRHYENVGAERYQFTSFVGNPNIPKFLKDRLLLKILQLPEVDRIVHGSLTDWGLAFSRDTVAKK